MRLLFIVVMVLGRAALRPLVFAYVVALAVVTLYGMLQIAELDPVDWQGDGARIFSLFGNVNFASGWTGAVVPFAVWGLLHTSERRIRIALSALLLGASVLLWQAGSAQGPLAAAAGVALLVAVWARGRGGDSRSDHLVRRWVPVLIAIGCGIAVIVVGLFVALRPDIGARQRVHFWDAAIRIFADHPLLGSGLDTYGDHFLAYRSAEGAVLYGFEPNQAPHNVPLGMLSNGGIVLGLAYLAFVLAVAVVLVTGLRRLRGDDRLMLAAFGAVWVGYQVQSVVSFDVPPVALLHYLSAGAIVVLAGSSPTSRVIELAGSRNRVRRRRGRRAGASGVDVAGVCAAAVLALLLVVLATRPVRADIVLGSAAPLLEPD